MKKNEILQRAISEGIYYIAQTKRNGIPFRCIRYATTITLSVKSSAGVNKVGLNVNDPEAVDLSEGAYKQTWSIDRKDICLCAAL